MTRCRVMGRLSGMRNQPALPRHTAELFPARIEWAAMNPNWLAALLPAVIGLLFLQLPIAHLFGVGMYGYAPGLGLMMGGALFFVGGVAVRELVRRAVKRG